MDKEMWHGPWACKVCKHTFKCQNKTGSCQTIVTGLTGGCYCNDHTLFHFLEEKMASCHVVPYIREPHIRKGRLISGTELLQT